jgi:three-Cys-motif partner protein
VKDINLDEVGPWSEIKLEIIKKYAKAYSKILTSRKFYHVYIDAFAGAGEHLSKTSSKKIKGSPVIALRTEPPFKEYYFVDLDPKKILALGKKINNKNNIFLYNDDCNKVLIEKIFPKVEYKDFKRGLCLIDPYGLDLDWKVVKTAGEMKTFDIFINFPIADINRNVLRHDRNKVSKSDIKRMNTFWGDQSWENIAYSNKNLLFPDMKEKQDNETVLNAYLKRLKNIAGYKNVPKPLAMKNSNNAVIYYLVFASQNKVANHIIEDIFKKYR